MTFPLVTIVVPARQEAADIEECLAAIAAQDYPVDRLEVFVVDGASEDGTADLARRALGGLGFEEASVLPNDVATTPSNLNLGLARSSGQILCRVDARTRIEPHYVRTCVEVLTTRPEVAVVGGAQIAIARDRTAKALGIARGLNNRWSMGGSRYRRRTDSGPSDTVYLGAFRTDDLRAVGGWDERLASNQDFDLNRRMAARGLVWFDARLNSGYLPRETFAALWRQYLRFGRAKVGYWRISGTSPQRRQRVLMGAPPAALLAVVALLLLLPDEGRIAVLAVVSAGLAVVELSGSEVPQGSVGAHLLSAWAILVVSTAWLLGVLTGRMRSSADHLVDHQVGGTAERA